MNRLLGCLLALAISVSSVEAQVIIQQSPTRLDACNVTGTATGAANTAVTVTITPPAGQFFYMCSVYIAQAANAAVTGAAGPAPIFTTTNLPTNLVWWGNNATQGTGLFTLVTDSTFDYPVKTAAAGTAFTVVTSAGQSTNSVRINVTGYFAP